MREVKKNKKCPQFLLCMYVWYVCLYLCLFVESVGALDGALFGTHWCVYIINIHESDFSTFVFICLFYFIFSIHIHWILPQV